MINQPQIFVIYETGQFGRTVCTVLTKDSEFKGDGHGVNNHKSNYKPPLENFHWDHEALALLEKTHDELKTFFSGIKDTTDYSVHNLASYKYAEIHYEKYFTRYLKVIMLPKRECLRSFAERLYEAHPPEHYWYMERIKNLNKVPDYFLKEMSIKEKYKVLTERFNRFLKIKDNLSEKDTIFFDPLDLFDHAKFQNLVDECTIRLGLESIVLPKTQIQMFLDKNKSFFDKHLNS